MYHAFYLFIRNANVEGMIQYLLLSYTMYSLCQGKFSWVNGRSYLFLNGVSFLLVNFIANLFLPAEYTTILGVHSLPYWFNFASCIALASLSSFLLLRHSGTYHILYILFYMAFVMLYKVVCSSLYALEPQIPAQTYQWIDTALIIAEILLLAAVTFLFQRFKLYMSIAFPRKNLGFIVYFPIGILICFIAVSSSSLMKPYIESVIAAFLLTVLPLIYYILWLIMQSYEEQRRLDLALTQTTAQLSRYRFSIEVQERIKKSVMN